MWSTLVVVDCILIRACRRLQAKRGHVSPAAVAALVAGSAASGEYHAQVLGAHQPGAPGDDEQIAAGNAGISQSMIYNVVTELSYNFRCGEADRQSSQLQ